jgi:hypothetical protein
MNKNLDTLGSRSSSFRGAASEVSVGGDTEVLLHTRRPEENDESDDSNEGGGELEGIDDTRTVPLSDGHGDEVEDGRKDEPGSAANAEDEVEETLVELSLLAPGHVEAVGEVGPDADPADKDVKDNEAKKSALSIDELGGSSSLASGRDDDEEDEVDDKIDTTDDKDDNLARKIVIGDGPAAGDGDEEDGKDDVGKTHKKLTEHTAAIGTNTIGSVDTPVDDNEEEGEDDEEDDTSEDENDGMGNTLAVEEEDGGTVGSTNKDEEDKVDNVKREKTLLVIADLITILIDEVNGVGDIKFVGNGAVSRRAVEQNDVPDVRTDVIVRLQLDGHVIADAERLTVDTLLHAAAALVLVVCIPLSRRIIVKCPPGLSWGVLGSSLVDDNHTLCLSLISDGREAETTCKSEIILGDKVIINKVSTGTSCQKCKSNQHGSLHFKNFSKKN